MLIDRDEVLIDRDEVLIERRLLLLIIATLATFVGADAIKKLH